MLVSCMLKAQDNQDDTLQVTFSVFIRGDFTDAETDNLNNIIVLNKNGRVTKYNERGDSIACFNEITKIGRPNAIDVSNPMKILLWSQRNATLTLLDRWLSQRNQIRINEPGANAVQAIACSYDNNIWYFNPIDQQLKKIDDQNQLLLESNDMRSVTGESINPIFLQDRDGWVMLQDTSKGIFLFDQFGVFKTKLKFKSQAAFMQNQVVYSINDNLLRETNLQTMQEAFHWIAQPSNEGKITSISKTSIILLKKAGLYLYKIKN
jgi:hypothetical protein